MMDEALALLEKLNALTDERGIRYADKVSYHEFKPWWFHQQFVFDQYIVPFVRRTHPAPLNQAFTQLRSVASDVHYRSMTALAIAQAIAKRPDFLTYTVDSVDEKGQNRWIPGLFTALSDRGNRVVELVWSLGGQKAIENAQRRRASVIYWQGLKPTGIKSLVWPEALHGQSTDAFLTELATRVMLPLAIRSTRMIPKLERLLRILRPRGVFAMDDTLNVFELIVACKRRDLPVVGLQHGQLTRFTVGMMGYGYDGEMDVGFDRYCVWGDLFKEVLVRHSKLVSPSSIVVTGRAGDVPSTLSAPPIRRGSEPRILFIMELYDDEVQAEVRAYITTLISTGFSVAIKPHPAAETHAHVPGARVTMNSLDVAIAMADVVVGSYSSALFEAIRLLKPVVLFKTSIWNDPNDLVPAGLADLALKPMELAAAVNRAVLVDADERERRRQAVFGEAESDGGQQVVNQMERLLRAANA